MELIATHPDQEILCLYSLNWFLPFKCLVLHDRAVLIPDASVLFKWLEARIDPSDLLDLAVHNLFTDRNKFFVHLEAHVVLELKLWPHLHEGHIFVSLSRFHGFVLYDGHGHRKHFGLLESLRQGLAQEPSLHVLGHLVSKISLEDVAGHFPRPKTIHFCPLLELPVSLLNFSVDLFGLKFYRQSL